MYVYVYLHIDRIFKRANTYMDATTYIKKHAETYILANKQIKILNACIQT